MQTLNRPTLIFAFCLSALAGCVDAIGFLQLSGHFVSFMSGNTTQLAVGLAQGNMSHVLLLAMIIGLFVAGSALGTFINHASAINKRAASVMTLVSLLLAGAALTYSSGMPLMAIALMAVAMGAENAVFQRSGDIAIGLTYMTGTLAKLGQRIASACLGSGRYAWMPYLLLWISLMAGGVTGAALYYWFGMHSLWLAVAWSAVLTVAAQSKRVLPS